MNTRWLAPLAIVLLAGCISSSSDDRDHDRDKDRSNAEERAEKYCVQEAKSRGLRVEDVGRVEKVAKKQYEVKLRVEPKNNKNKNKGKDDKKNDDYRVLCRYDDKARNARID